MIKYQERSEHTQYHMQLKPVFSRENKYGAVMKAFSQRVEQQH